MNGSQTAISLTRHQLLIGIGCVAIVALFGLGGYLLGHSTGEDLDAARAEGTEQGQREGAAQGAEEGFTQGRKEGRKEAFTKSYEESYRKAYRGAYDDAGLDPPEDVDVPKPEK